MMTTLDLRAMVGCVLGFIAILAILVIAVLYPSLTAVAILGIAVVLVIPKVRDKYGRK